MRRLRKVLNLPAADRRLLGEAVLFLEGTKLGMRLLPFRVLRRLLTRITLCLPASGRRRGGDRASVEAVARAVEVASRGMLGVKTCLAQALAAQSMLARRGYPALLHIGVAKGERGRFQAHAWVENEGEAVVGGPRPGRYTTLTTFEVPKSRSPR